MSPRSSPLDRGGGIQHKHMTQGPQRIVDPSRVTFKVGKAEQDLTDHSHGRMGHVRVHVDHRPVLPTGGNLRGVAYD